MSQGGGGVYSVGMRDYATEMRRHIEQATESGVYVPAQVAERIVIKLREEDPELLDQWLHAQAVNFIRDAINTRDRSRRAYVRMHSGRAAFAKAIEKREQGDLTALNSWLNVVYPTSVGERKQFRYMRADEVDYAADRYERLEVDNRFVKLFLRAVAKQLGELTVEERYSEEELRRMWNSLTR